MMTKKRSAEKTVRDRFGSDGEESTAKIKQLNFFNLLAYKLGGPGTENPRVGAERRPVDSAPGHHFP